MPVSWEPWACHVVTYHPSGGEIGTLLVLFAISKHTVQRPYPRWDQIVRLKEIQILRLMSACNPASAHAGHVHHGRCRDPPLHPSPSAL